jgi:hypothetical protein
MISIVCALLLIIGLCACKKDAKKEAGLPEFPFTAVEYVKQFNESCGDTLTGIGELDASDVVNEKSNFSVHGFNDFVCFIAYTTPETNKIQNTTIALLNEGLDDSESIVLFGSYAKIMLATYLSNEDQLKEAITKLRLAEYLPLGYQNVYENDHMVAYFMHDNAGLRLLVLPIAAKYTGDDLLPPAPESTAASASSATVSE